MAHGLTPFVLWRILGGFLALPDELGKGTGRGSDGKMELPELPSSPVFLAVRVFYQLDNLQLDPLPVFKLSPSVFLNTKFNPRNDDTDREKKKNQAISHFLERSGFIALHDPLENTRNLCTSQKQTPGCLKICLCCAQSGVATAEGHKRCINRKEVLL